MKYKKIHFVGIKGVGMTPLAIIVKEAGINVSGSDVGGDFITKTPLEKAGIIPLPGFKKEHVIGANLVVMTGAHGGFENIEIKSAEELGIKVIPQAEFIGMVVDGEIMGKKFDGIAIAGTHGKTTTTAMTTTILMQNDLDPAYLIGTSNIPSLSSPGHYGKGKYFVLEADEYATDPASNLKSKFLWQHPKIAVFTNIEHDHMDVFKNLDEVVQAFQKLANQIQEDGMLIGCGDDKEVQQIIKNFKGNKITYGFSESNDYVIKRASISSEHTFFRVEAFGTDLGEFAIQVIGEHNALNALASIIVATEVGLTIEQIKKAIKHFKGSRRRFEYIGTLESGAKLYDDYAHHPTEIKKTLRAMKQLHTGKKIIAIFQPHTYSRTKNLFEQFVKSFDDADAVVITDIYASMREAPDPSVSSKNLSLSIGQIHKSVKYIDTLDNVIKYVTSEKPNEQSVVITLGAGDIYTIRDSMILKNKK